MVKLVLFDIDGTLIHTNAAGVKAFAKAFVMQFGLDGAEALNFAGRTDTGLVREFFRKHKIEPTKEHFREFFDCYIHLLDHMLIECGGDILPGVCRLIHELQRMPNPPLIGLLTGNIRLGAEIKLRHYSLWDFFKTGAFADDSEDRNQIAAIAMERGAQMLNRKLRGEEVLVIGDTPLDIACGRAIDARVLAVATGRSSVAELQAHKPDWAVSDLEQMRTMEILGRKPAGKPAGRSLHG
ncbi:HAD family hydrolase [Pedosphaera parvula]|uniref:phosphoglycolate phosphatase n=1 Tax=Pedosphaera parvula (strain Ellin514) TaxID=320771 RepID=B9XSM9_PEDPL|nr:HAD hydrolase-like protein [Pedosphaera parvula]EEF57148.1 Haloacid dehalogenase domain protein hydrolase [Pedosphaera parvula Ellin514]